MLRISVPLQRTARPRVHHPEGLRMEHRPRTAPHRWGIILAGGSGKRLRPYITERFGTYRPKQYCALIGTRSMLRHTVDRVASLFPYRQLLVTVNAAHRPWFEHDLHDLHPHSIILQPNDRETAPSVLLPLLHVLHADPSAMVGIFPADHFILREEQYRYCVEGAFRVAEEHPDHLVMLGVSPTSQQTGYGWIEPGTELSRGLRTVQRFWEKPDPPLMQYLREHGCLWNTMTVIGRADLLHRLLEEEMPDVALPFRRIAGVIGTAEAERTITDVFAALPSESFSRGLLERIPHRLSVLRIDGVYWNDWGDEERIRTDIGSLEQHEEHHH